MTEKEFNSLQRGDIVQNLGSGNTYIVADLRDGRATLINIVIAENHSEWALMRATVPYDLMKSIGA